MPRTHLLTPLTCLHLFIFLRLSRGILNVQATLAIQDLSVEEGLPLWLGPP